MIRLFDATTLALTKLRTRRIRTAVTVVISSLLFSVIVLAVVLLQGGINSINKFTDGSLSGRYLTTASYTPQSAITDSSLPDTVKVRATEIYTKTILDKKAAAKSLGIEYDSATEKKPLTSYGDGVEMLDSSSLSAVQAFNEYLATLPSVKQKLTDTITPFRPIHTYEMTLGGASGHIKQLKNGIEDFAKPIEYPNGNQSADVSFGWFYVDQSVTQSFMLTANQLNKQKNTQDIPVVAPIDKVEEALGLKRLANTVSSKDKLDRIRYIRDHAETATFSVCYRNSVSQTQISNAINVANEIEKNKNNKDYQKPSLIYGLPVSDGCKAASVTRDVRTAAEKKLATKQAEFDRMFAQETEPIQQKVTFRVVGLSSNGLGVNSLSGIDSLLATVVGSTLDNQWVVPQQMYEAMPNKQDFTNFLPTVSGSLLNVNYNSSRIIAEFDTALNAKTFVTKVGCGFSYCANNMSAIYFGSNSVLINDIRDQVTRILGYVALVIMAIAAVIMMGMTGRVIGDSRRETAVFRAIGAKRNDIRLIYSIYTIILSLIIIVASLVIGIVSALWMNAAISPDATAQAHLAYIFADDTLSVNLIGIWWQALVVLAGLIVVTGLIGMLLPLSRNLGRSPIKDMRDDT